MSPPSGARGRNWQVQGLPRSAVAKISELLQDPEVRNKVMENGRTLLELARQWQEDRRNRERRREGPGPGERLRRRASQQFGVGRLRSRVDRVGEALDTLCSESPELADALGELRSDVTRIEQRIPMAEALSGRPRRRMLRAFDHRLDAIEGALADALLPSSGDSG